MDQTRYTLVGLFFSAILAIAAGFIAQWYQAGARPMGKTDPAVQTALQQTVVSITQTAEWLPTPSPTDNELGTEPTPSFQANLLTRIQSWDLVTFDGFDSNQSGWGQGRATGRSVGQRSIEEGMYVWDLISKESMIWVEAPLGAPFEEFVASVDVAKDSAEFGELSIVFRQTDYENYFHFGLCADSQSYEVWRKLAGEWNELISCTLHDAALPLETNNLSVVALDNSYFLFINAIFVESFDDSSLSGGSVGVMVELNEGRSNIFKFDNFELRSPLHQ